MSRNNSINIIQGARTHSSQPSTVYHNTDLKTHEGISQLSEISRYGLCNSLKTSNIDLIINFLIFIMFKDESLKYISKQKFTNHPKNENSSFIRYHLRDPLSNKLMQIYEKNKKEPIDYQSINDLLSVKQVA